MPWPKEKIYSDPASLVEAVSLGMLYWWEEQMRSPIGLRPFGLVFASLHGDPMVVVIRD